MHFLNLDAYVEAQLGLFAFALDHQTHLEVKMFFQSFSERQRRLQVEHMVFKGRRPRITSAVLPRPPSGRKLVRRIGRRAAVKGPRRWLPAEDEAGRSRGQ